MTEMRTSILVLTMFAILRSSLESENLTCNSKDLKALQDFSEGTNSILEGWSIESSSDCCNWPGIVCSTQPSRVIKMELSQKNLEGELRESLGNLDHLVTLNFSINHLRGSLPNSIFLLEKLQVLDLSFNFFSGEIPSQLETPWLNTLHLSQNLLTGNLPSRIANMTRLTTLDISNNVFSGTIPDVFDNFENLQFFLASSNSFHGGLPVSLLNSSTIRSINLRNNSLSGPITLTCGSNTNLSLLDLGTNRFSGPIPGSVSSCRKLQSINLSRNNLSGAVPESFRNLQSLSFLSISNSTLTNISATLQTLQHCKALSTLILTRNFPAESLHLLPQTLQFENIKVLVIANCRLTGAIPPWLRACRKLQLLDLSWNRLAGAIPPWLGEFDSLFYLDLSNNSLTGEIPRSITQLQALSVPTNTTSTMNIPLFQKRNQSSKGLQYNRISSFPPTLDLSFNFLSGEIPPEFGHLKELHILNLKFNNLSGSIPINLSSIPSLETLDLSHNNLIGTIPKSLSNLNFLSIFSVAYNRLSGEIPSTGQFVTFPASSFEGNPDLCNHDASSCDLSNQFPVRRTRNKRVIIIAAGITSAAIVLLLLIFISIFRILARNFENDEHTDDYEQRLVILFKNDNTKDLIVDDLLKATNNFDQANIIGCGGFGLVYKASLSDGRKVAIKRLSGECLQLEREFQAEVETLTRAQHPNLVLLQGYCKYNNDRLLIYTYMENSSLDYWLHEKIDGASSLDWKTRRRIAQGAARGLAYLHQSCDPHILHRDIKSSNILLDEDFEAHLADFGLARLILPYDTHVTTDLVGTLGYIPPEYGQASVATYKGDIYSFGVVLMELVTGRRPMDMSKPRGSRDVIVWVREMRKEKREVEVIDPFIYDKDHHKEILRVLEIACLCVDEFPKRRPSTQQLLSWLHNIHM